MIGASSNGASPLGVDASDLVGAPPAVFRITSYRHGADETVWDLHCDPETAQLVELLAMQHHVTPSHYLAELITVALRCNASGRFAH